MKRNERKPKFEISLQNLGCLCVVFFIFFIFFILYVHWSVFYNSEGEFQWSAISSLAAIFTMIFTIVALRVNIRNNDKSIRANLILKNKQDWIGKVIDGVVELQKAYRMILRTCGFDRGNPEKEVSYAEFQGSISRLKFLFLLENNEKRDSKYKNKVGLNLNGELSKKFFFNNDKNKNQEEETRVEKAKSSNRQKLKILQEAGSNEKKIEVIIEFLEEILNNIGYVGTTIKSDKYQVSANYEEYNDFINILVNAISLYIVIEKKEIEEKVNYDRTLFTP